MDTRRHPTPERPLNILLVEDNPGDVRLTMEALKDTGFPAQVSVARDGEEAMDILLRRDRFVDAPPPDLILLDLNLPKKNGRELLVEIKATPELRRIPVMILSTSQSEADVAFSYDHHANCYIHKPMEFENYFEVVQSIERFWCGIASLPGRHKAASRAAFET